MDLEDLPTLANFLGSQLRQAANCTSRDLSRRLTPKGVTVAEWEMLWTMYGNPISPSAVAEDLGVDKGGITRLTNRLVRKGLVTRRPNKEDKRGQLLVLTRKGSALALELRALAEEAEGELKTRLKPKRYAATVRLIKGLLDAYK